MRFVYTNAMLARTRDRRKGPADPEQMRGRIAGKNTPLLFLQYAAIFHLNRGQYMPAVLPCRNSRPGAPRNARRPKHVNGHPFLYSEIYLFCRITKQAKPQTPAIIGFICSWQIPRKAQANNYYIWPAYL